MRKLLTMTVAIAGLLMASGASTAFAQIDVEMAFDPTEAAAGDEVSFFVSVANLGDEAVLADLELTLSFGDFTVGPILGKLPLAAGEELSQELMLVVPALPTGGDLTIELTATAGEFSDTATATLTILGEGSGSTAQGIQGLGDAIQQSLIAGGTVGAESSSFGELKVRY